MIPSIIILSFNSQATIKSTILAAKNLSDDVHVVDSYSTDSTLAILEDMLVNVVQHEFINYSVQRNWAIDNLPMKHPWELHLDADEILSNPLIKEIENLKENPNINGFLIPRLVKFMGSEIRHGGMYPIYHQRLFRHGEGRCEERLYDQHFVVKGNIQKLQYPMIDDIRMTLFEWTERHNKWSDLQTLEYKNKNTLCEITPRLNGTAIERKRYMRERYALMPLFIRPFMLFIYRYFFRLGFLDGKPGLIFFILQTFWFRFLIDAKLFEMLQENRQ